MVSKKKKLIEQASHGFDSWFNYYDKIFGSRWQNSLYPSLTKKNKSIAFMNPFFDRFPITPQLFHPNAQWCEDSELYQCIHVTDTQVTNGESEEEIGTFVHPSQLRLKRDVQTWINSEEFERSDSEWYAMAPNESESINERITYYPNFAKLREYSQLAPKLYKLSWRDIDPYYIIDPASVRVARLMRDRGNSVLDMCASPGGKSLLILSDLFESQKSGTFWKLVSNDSAFKRSKQMHSVIHSFVPRNILHKNEHKIVLTNIDAKLWGLCEPNQYDSILCDVPCSTDRHLLHSNSKDTMQKWTLKSTKNIAKTQYALLRSAMESVKIGGFILYATCTLNPIENDCLIQSLLKKHKNKVQCCEMSEEIMSSVAERTEYGMQILPDNSPFCEGPLYACLLQRIY